MTAVAETSTLQPPALTSTWARRITDWETRNDGKLWQCRLIGQHHGAEVVQHVQAHWFSGGWRWHYSTLYVDRRGPSCPPWCSKHANVIADTSELDDECIDHTHRIFVGLGTDGMFAGLGTAVVLDALEDPATGKFGEVSISTPDRLGPMDATKARLIAAALLEAADLLEGGQR
jgi:hypothetical protein